MGAVVAFRRPRALVTAAVVVAGLAGLTACSGSSAGGPGATASDAAASNASTTAPAPTASSATTAPSATTAAPGGSSGSGTPTVVPTAPISTAPAVPIGSPAIVGGVTVTIGKVTAFTGTGVAPGELGGPAVAVPVTLRNGTGAAVSAADVVVDLVKADGSPASPLTGTPADPLAGTVAPGASASGVYAFTLAADARAAVSITVSYRTGVPVARFTGSVAS